MTIDIDTMIWILVIPIALPTILANSHVDNAIKSLLQTTDLFRYCDIQIATGAERFAAELRDLPQAKRLIGHLDQKSVKDIQLNSFCSVLLFPSNFSMRMIEVMPKIPRSYGITFGDFALMQNGIGEFQRNVLYLHEEQVTILD